MLQLLANDRRRDGPEKLGVYSDMAATLSSAPEELDGESRLFYSQNVELDLFDYYKQHGICAGCSNGFAHACAVGKGCLAPILGLFF